LNNAADEWKRPPREWFQAKTQFAVVFGERVVSQWRKTSSRTKFLLVPPPLGVVDVYAARIPSVKFVPVVHVNYAETVLPMKDRLPKLKDFPAEMGGAGV